MPDILLLKNKILNGGIVGDLLTTIGSTVDSDKFLINEGGYEF